MLEKQRLFAVLIDGDNAQPSLIPQILSAVSKYGRPIIKRIYGDFSQAQLKSWESTARQHKIDIEHFYNASNGKNASDIALVIDAMDLFWKEENKLDFCIVSSDSDFTHLAKRLTRGGRFVLGIGRAGSLLGENYDEFISIESLDSQNDIPTIAEVRSHLEDSHDENFLKRLIETYEQAVHENIQDAHNQVVLTKIRDLMVGFLPDEYRKMPKFVSKIKALAEIYPNLIEVGELPDSKPITHYVRIKRTMGEEIEKFYEAYVYVADKRKLKDKDGWVLLATIREAMLELFPDYQPLIYHDIKYKQIKKVVEQMVKDYPNNIELKTDSEHPHIRMKR